MSIIAKVQDKITTRQRLTDEDALALFATSDLIGLANLANQKNKDRNGHDVFFNVNRHINPTNVCVLSCKFCSFSRKPGQPGSFAYSIDEMLARAKTAVEQGATEVHMVGGLHPRWTFDYYLDMIRSIKTTFPDLHIKAFTAVELDWFVKKTRTSLPEVLEKLIDAGLGSLPGGGAEIFHPEIRDQICDTKVSADQWIATHELAHNLGLKSNATMLYGHIESAFHRVDHMRRLRELQDKTRGFNAFIPLSFQPHDNDMGIDRFTLGVDDLRTVAVARLYLDNFKNIKTYWIMSGQDISQIALSYGANDLDGTVTDEKISAMAGGRSGLAMSRSGIIDLIENANRRAVERDTLYRPVQVIEPQLQVDPVRLEGIIEEWHTGLSLVSDDIAYLLQFGDLNLISAMSLEIKPFSVDPLFNIDCNDAAVLDLTEIETSANIWMSIAPLLARLKDTATEKLELRFPTAMSPSNMLKLISFIRATVDSDLHIDITHLPSLSPTRVGNAKNQDPRFKTFVLCAAYGVNYLSYAKEKDSGVDKLIEEELALLVAQKPAKRATTGANARVSAT